MSESARYDYDSLVAELKALTQTVPPAVSGEEPETASLPMAEDEWNTRPDTVSYGIVSKDFEAGAMEGDDMKLDVSYEGSVDLFSLMKSGAGWIPLITGTLTKYCGPCWRLNSRSYERDTGLYHWEWVFEIGA